MAWSKVYTGGTGGGVANHNFFVYFFDTYLAGKTGWSVGAHPGGQAFRRKINFTANNVVTGSPYTTYWYMSWGSTAGTGNTIWYLDTTYTSVPGDLGTSENTAHLTGARTGEWTIWESGLNNSEFCVYNGRTPWFYWPAVTKMMAWDDGTWDGTGTTYYKRTHLWPGGAQGSQHYNPSYVGGTINSSVEYYLLPDCGFNADVVALSGVAGQFPILFEGVQWMTSVYATTSTGGLVTESYPMISRGPSDTAFKYGGDATFEGDKRWFGGQDAIILQDTASGKWYLHHAGSITTNCIVFDCGSTEPVLNA
jgi:hypothetical protein